LFADHLENELNTSNYDPENKTVRSVRDYILDVIYTYEGYKHADKVLKELLGCTTRAEIKQVCKDSNMDTGEYNELIYNAQNYKQNKIIKSVSKYIRK
jgi:hypothetical protein